MKYLICYNWMHDFSGVNLIIFFLCAAGYSPGRCPLLRLFAWFCTHLLFLCAYIIFTPDISCAFFFKLMCFSACLLVILIVRGRSQKNCYWTPQLHFPWQRVSYFNFHFFQYFNSRFSLIFVWWQANLARHISVKISKGFWKGARYLTAIETPPPRVFYGWDLDCSSDFVTLYHGSHPSEYAQSMFVSCAYL